MPFSINITKKRKRKEAISIGIDIYATWKDMTKEEKDKQYSGFDVTVGRYGYLRESYHGDPYATQYLVSEAFESENGEAEIPAKTLRERLEHTLSLAAVRNIKLYQGEGQEEVKRSFVEFVELCERKEKETGEPVTIIASY